MNRLTGLALLIAVIAAMAYSAGKHSRPKIARLVYVDQTPPKPAEKKTYKTVVDIDPLPDIPTRFGTVQQRAEKKSNETLGEAIRNIYERRSNGNG